MHREIGMPAARVDVIPEEVERSEIKSDASRASMHRRMDEIVDGVSKVELMTGAVQENGGKMPPVTDDVKRWKLMGVGGHGTRHHLW
ncbi:DUF1515 family protein [Rhizobium cauense]|uniref:DUF1515 family protein n=1 Tax=Rhizobium cauense TaxID=1166683 RepID=UPI001CB797AC|nr:DUF1515 family protein [Rhizobium cauense]